MGDLDPVVVRRAAELCDRLEKLDAQIAELRTCTELSVSYTSDGSRQQFITSRQVSPDYPNGEWDHQTAEPIIAVLIKSLVKQRAHLQREMRQLRFRKSGSAAPRIPKNQQSVRMLQQLVREESASIRLVKAS